MGKPVQGQENTEHELRSALPRPGLLVTDSSVIAASCQDFRGWHKGEAVALARPRSVNEVQAVLSVGGKLGCAIVPQGGNTSLCGGAVPSEGSRPSIILSTSGLNRIRAIEPHTWSVVAEAGCTVAQIQDAARSEGRHFGLDFGSRDSATVGGAIATNAGGMSVLRYGNCRDLVLGLEVVLPDGQLWSGLRALRKDNSGFDLKHLFIGSEGTLGIITAASLKLHAAETVSASALLRVDSLEAATQFADLALEMAAGELSAIELMPVMGIRRSCELLLRCRPPLDLSADWFVLLRLAGQQSLHEKLETLASRALEMDLCSDAVLSQSAAQETQLWAIRDSFSELHKFLGASIRFDYCVPLGRIPELYRRLCAAIDLITPGFVPFGFGHMGDGNLHYSACQPEGIEASDFLGKRKEIETVANTIVWELGGTVSAEHGIGQLHRHEMSQQKSSIELALMRRLKLSLDPSDRMNPGKIF
ncbi:FAD-binding oxidoreductase [Bradyrhizobium mercantei]|uniref:FAD-binding oxidoreductase n=1 Tax=Bradyrhizobium mercantei TaxID=1904807 RepID=UPI001356610F|nr:FAD-binding oxidoreductase [Bradyrhizobium mercantei]